MLFPRPLEDGSKEGRFWKGMEYARAALRCTDPSDDKVGMKLQALGRVANAGVE